MDGIQQIEFSVAFAARLPNRVLAAELLSTRRLGERGGKCVGASGRAPPGATRQCPAVEHDSVAAYFLPVIEEVLELRVSPDYLQYLRHKFERVAPR